MRLLQQDLTLGPEVARQFADAMTLLYQRPVDPATIESADLAALFRLQEVRFGRTPVSRTPSPASCEAVSTLCGRLHFLSVCVERAGVSAHAFQ